MTKVPPKLQREWAKRLAATGFVDVEDNKGRLKQPETRTQAWAMREITAEFFQLLDSYLMNAELNRLERRILERHSEGTRLEPISLEVFRSVAYVKSVIYKHRKIILHRK